MTLAEEFNSLNGIIVTRKDLEKLLEKAEKERHTIISKRIIKVLHAFADDTFLIELQNLVEPYGLNGVDTDDVTGLIGGLEFIPESEDVGLGKPVSPNEIYDMVTQRMIDLIKDANKGDYKRAWKEEGYLIPYNFVSKKAYRGVNVVMLSPLFGLLDNPYFLTFNQIQEKGGKIRKGSHGYKVVYFSSFNKEYSDAEIERLNEKIIDNKLEKGDEKTIFFLKYYNVFNGADIEGIDFDLDNFSLQGKVINNEMETGNNEKIEIAEAIVKNYPKPQPEIKFTGSRAFYQPANDFLSMPDISKFKTSQDFYRTYFHELSHSTGHESRLKRGLANEFGSPEYAFEELIAEFGAVFLSAQAGIMFYTNKNHAGYLKGWNEVLLPNLENDNRFLMKASSQAQKASDYILQPDAKGDFLFMKGSEKQKAKKGDVKEKPTKKVVVKTVKKTPTPKKIIDKSVKPKSVDKKANSIQAVTKKEKEEEPKISGGQYALFGAVKDSKMNRNSLAYKMANKPKNVNYFKIDNAEIASFLGQIERKKKESIVISLTGGQGSMKTRMAFQFMNALAQNYKVGHASIEEHPESNLYFDKAEQYLNAKALNNIEAPEVKSVQELEQLIKKNDVIVIDSFTKMQEMHKGFEVDKDLRKKYDGKLFIVIFQQTTDGKMRGGSKSQFDADIVLFTEKKTDYRDNYIYADKNRYQDKPLDGLKFNIFNKKLVQNESEVQAEPKTKKKLSFSVN
jgi:antirestriction protein ArdC/nucleoside-triphosphatase THEP1